MIESEKLVSLLMLKIRKAGDILLANIDKTLTTNENDYTIPPNVLYSHYKTLSEGIFEKLEGKLSKKELQLHQERNWLCAKKRFIFAKKYVNPKAYDDGHEKIIQTAIIKALACYVAGQPLETLNKWFNCMRVVYNAVVNHYNVTQELHEPDYYHEMINQISCHKEFLKDLPNFLMENCVQYACDVLKEEIKFYELVPITDRPIRVRYLCKRKATRYIFWCLCGFSEHYYVKNLYHSISEELTFTMDSSFS